MNRTWAILRLAALSTIIFCSPEALAQTATEWVNKANEHYEAERFVESADAYDQAIEAGAKNPLTFYNAACSAALANRVDAAFKHLDGAVARGWRDVAFLEQDSDLTSLHDDPRWEELLASCRQAGTDFLASIEKPTLREELLEMRRIDQAVRSGEPLPELSDKDMGDVDAVNTARMKEIVEEHGWPTKRLVGEDGARSAWLLVQHADANPAFQRQCLELMKASDSGQVSAVDVAYLTDRVLVNEGKDQIYGTQFWTVDGYLVPRPIADEARVEALRAEIGMTTMQEYHVLMTGLDWVPNQ